MNRSEEYSSKNVTNFFNYDEPIEEILSHIDYQKRFSNSNFTKIK